MCTTCTCALTDLGKSLLSERAARASTMVLQIHREMFAVPTSFPALLYLTGIKQQVSAHPKL